MKKEEGYKLNLSFSGKRKRMRTIKIGLILELILITIFLGLRLNGFDDESLGIRICLLGEKLSVMLMLYPLVGIYLDICRSLDKTKEDTES